MRLGRSKIVHNRPKKSYALTSDNLKYRILARLLRLGGAADLADLGLLGSPFAIKNMAQHGLLRVEITVTAKGKLVHNVADAKQKKRERRHKPDHMLTMKSEAA